MRIELLVEDKGNAHRGFGVLCAFPAAITVAGFDAANDWLGVRVLVVPFTCLRCTDCSPA